MKGTEIMAGKDKIQLAENDPSTLALLRCSEGQTITDLLAQNFGAGSGIQASDLDRITVPGAGGSTWAVPTLEGEEQRPTIEGIIIAHSDPRSYYTTSFDESGGEDPPECSSTDSIMGTTIDGKIRPCKGCEFDRWGSGKGGSGKACKQRKELLVLEPQALLPFIVSAPTGSLREMNRYFMRLTQEMLSHLMVVTKFGLEVTKNAKNIKYSQVQPSVARRLTADEIKAVDSYRAALMPAFEARVAEE